MIKSFLIVISLQIVLYSSGQIVLVVSQDFNTSKAYMQCFEDGKKVFNTTFEVNIGTNGLGWGLGEIILKQSDFEPKKQEGDKKAPAGIFKLTHIFGYKKDENTNLPYLHASKELICVDDVDSKFYNQIMLKPKIEPKSFELMKRDDNQYELGIVVSHNKDAIKKSGSCIFMHVAKSKDSSTAGCTSMSIEELKKITSWLDESKSPILIQIPKSSASEILELYPELKSSKLLKPLKPLLP